MLISLIIPVYNAEQYLDETLNSVISQNFSDYEVILIDDGSVDRSGLICDRYSKAYPNIRVIHKANGGQSSARNMGIKAAKGDFLAFLDSDDFICDLDYFKCVSSKIRDDTDVVLFRYYKYYSSESMSDCGISMSGLDNLDKNTMLHELVKRDAFFCSCWSKWVRRSLIVDNRLFFDESLSCEDMDWYFSVIEKVRNIAVVDKPFICYRQRSNSVTSTFSPDNIEDYIYTIEKWENKLKCIDELVLRETLLAALAKLYCNLLISFSRHKNALQSKKKRIYNMHHLLRYHLNPRTKKIWLCKSALGIRLTCLLIGVLDKIQ